MKKSKPAKNVELIGYKFYGIPSDQDRQLELKTFGCCRKIWNLMLADKSQYYQTNQKSLNNSGEIQTAVSISERD